MKTIVDNEKRLQKEIDKTQHHWQFNQIRVYCHIVVECRRVAGLAINPRHLKYLEERD